MIRISFLALNNILIDEGFRYIIERSGSFTDRRILMFVSSKRHLQGGHVYMGTQFDRQDAVSDKEQHLGSVLLHYDTTTQCVLAICSEWHELVLRKKREAVEKALAQKTTSIIVPTVDEFGRSFRE